MERSETIVAYIFLSLSAILFLGGAYLVYKEPDLLAGLGGVFVFIPLILFIFVAAYFFKKLLIQISVSPMVILGIVGMNFISYYEVINGALPKRYDWLLIGLVLYAQCFFLFMISRGFKPSEVLDKAERGTRLKLILALGASPFISVPFVVITVSAFDLMQPQDIRRIYDVLQLNSVTIAGAFVILGLVISAIYVLKIGDEDLVKLLKKENVSSFPKQYEEKIRNASLYLFGLIVILGSLLETQRGMWLMWVESIFMVLMMSVISWKIYKNIPFDDMGS